MDRELIERLAREAGCDLLDSPEGVSVHKRAALQRVAALIAEECAKEADAEEAIRSEAGCRQPHDSPSRDRCFAGARAATNIAYAIRAKFGLAKQRVEG